MNGQMDRNLGVDAFRIWTMLSIVVLHLLKHGGILKEASGSNFYAVWLIQSLVVGSVDCFALISGYVGYGSAKTILQRYKKGILLWLQVVFYSVVLYLIVAVLSNRFSMKELAKAFLPVTSSQYWYFSGYALVVIVAPWMDRFLSGLNDSETRTLGIAMGATLLYISAVGILYDPFKLSGGYSGWWLLILYGLGSYVKKMGILDRLSKPVCVGVIILGTGLSALLKWLVPTQNVLNTYTSPATIVVALAMLVFFAKLRIGGDAAKVIKLVAPLTFGVYLIHDHPLVREFLIEGKLTELAESSTVLLIVSIGALALLIFALSSAIEFCRMKLFSVAGRIIEKRIIDN